MAAFSIFGDATPTLALNEGDTTAYDMGMAFYPFGPSAVGWLAVGGRVFLPAGSTPPTTGYVATLWQGQNATTATQLATASFGTMTIGAWNEVFFAEAVPVTAGNYYWISVHFPGGKYGSQANKFDNVPVQAVGGQSLFAADKSEVTPGNGAFVATSTPGTALTNAPGNAPWYGMDILIDTSAVGTYADTVGISDAVTAERTGLSGTTTLNATATDPLGAVAATSRTINNSGTVSRTLKRSLLGERLNWGSVMSADQGPLFITEDNAMEVAAAFTLQWPCRLNKARIYKAPALAGSIPVTVWAPDNSILTTTTVTWTADEGGWREITFPATVSLNAGVEYRVSYHAANKVMAYTPWVFNGQDFVEPPFMVPMFKESSTSKSDGMTYANSHTAPVTRVAHNYYIDPIVEWDSDLPGHGVGYGDQWTNYTPAQAFPVGVFYCDPPFVAEYIGMGVNTFVGIPITVSGYREAFVGTTADVWATAYGGPEMTQYDAAYGARIKGYFIWDEPDMTHNYGSPQQLRDLVSQVRKIDSTRPVMVNVGKPAAINQGWQAAPVGAPPLVLNANFREYAELADFYSCDFYNLTADGNEGRYGIWTYPVITHRMKSQAESRKEVWGYVESTSQTPGAPLPDDVYKACWAHLIAGANGLVFFDHRFPSAAVTMDFAAMLHDPPMKAKVQAMITDLQLLAVALKDQDRGLVTSVSSTNTTSGPKGGMYGVPIHYTSRQDATKTYVFSQAIRPGSTTATFTVPAAANKTITVRGESRTLTANGSGVFTDNFAADYTVHLYEWTT